LQISKGGQAIKLFYSSQIANPQILGLIQNLRIRKFLRFAGTLTVNPQISSFYQPGKKRKVFEPTIEIASTNGKSKKGSSPLIVNP
jgi:hypothetical protein